MRYAVSDPPGAITATLTRAADLPAAGGSSWLPDGGLVVSTLDLPSPGAKASGKTVTVSPKSGVEVDAITLLDSLRTSGFPATQLELTGGQTLKMDVGHMCCMGCANGLKATKLKSCLSIN